MSAHADDAPTPVNQIALRGGDRLVEVDVEAIDYVETAGNYVRVHVGRAVLQRRATLGEMHQILGRHRFVRIRRSTLVRIGAIRVCVPYAKGSYRVVLRNGTELRSSRHFLPELRRTFGEA
ncbi:MAG TPA: LytTR family DNA-binding domain-containing protein [Gemmatimonadaceae bacterium]